MTHLGGVFLIVALGVVFGLTGSFAFSAIRQLSPAMQSTVFVCVLVAASAKSAQVPLFTWLPDAMEAPTPVSAYLHAAAMVKAGVYLMARVILDTGHVPATGRVRSWPPSRSSRCCSAWSSTSTRTT